MTEFFSPEVRTQFEEEVLRQEEEANRRLNAAAERRERHSALALELTELKNGRLSEPKPAINRIARAIADSEEVAELVVSELTLTDTRPRVDFPNLRLLIVLQAEALRLRREDTEELQRQRDRARSALGWEQEARYYENLDRPEYYEMGQG